MTKDGLKRKLSTIFSADAVDFSGLMCRDEDMTVTTIDSYREIMSVRVEQHRGHVVDAVGDNLLPEFGCAVDAVACAIAVQEEIHDRNAGLRADKQMRFRIGINFGEVIEESANQ